MAHSTPREKNHEYERRFKGIPAAPGIVIGEATVFFADENYLQNETTPPEAVGAELARFAEAMHASAEEYRHIIEIAQHEEHSVLPILETYLLMLTDARAQQTQWPTKPVRIIIPYPPGGQTDVVEH